MSSPISPDVLEAQKALLENKVLEEVSKQRALYWAKRYHLNTRAEPMRFGRGSFFLYELYKNIDKYPKMVVEKSVQCGLSELFIIQSHVEAGEMGLTVMYVLPKYELRNRFVNNRIYKIHKRIPHYSYLVFQAETKVHRTSLMHFGSGTLAYVGSNVEDEFIEIPVDSAYIDEKDRCNLSNLNYLPDRLTASPYQFQREISNPTTEGFGIDERYQESTQGQWMLKCPKCGQWFVPDFFRHVVREVGSNLYKPRDPDADPDPFSNQEINLIHDCGGSVDRLQRGEWVHQFESREWAGFRVSKIVARLNKKATLRELYRKWSKSVGNDLKTQVFMNSDLGLPYSSRGAKITRGMLNDCQRGYEWPVRTVRPDRPRFMGVDVGDKLHVVMRERMRTDDGYVMPLLGTWTLPGFNQLAQLLREWKPKCVVIDALPEIHKVMDLKEDFGQVWSSRFQNDATALSVHKDKRELRMDRTAILDYVRQGFESQTLWLPMQSESVDDGAYYEHLLASTRILEANEEHPEKSRFVWREGSKPDHYFLAEAYCMQAGMVMPEHGVFDFFESESEALDSYGKRRSVSAPDLSDTEREEIADKQRLTPDVFLNKVFNDNVNTKPVKPPVDDQNIADVCNLMFKSQGYVDVVLAAQTSNEHEEDVKRVLLMRGYKESRIKGQYVK